MKKYIILITIFVILFLPCFYTKAEEINYGIVRADIGINVRKLPGEHDKIGEGIANNQIVTIYDEVPTDDGSTICPSGKWYKIKYLQVSEGFGYACSDFIEKLSTTLDSEFEAVLQTFPESYHEGIKYLHQIYPNAVFRSINIDLDFQDVINNEKQPGKNLVWDSNNSRNGLKNINTYILGSNTFRNDYAGGGVNWYAVNEETIAYYVDPRNFLNEKTVFMFETLSYNPMFHNIEGVEAALRNSFMYNAYIDGGTTKKFSDIIMESGINNNISPYYIASRILQETGTGRSALVRGIYPEYPEYNGYYNFFNYGATGKNIVLNGLKYAKEKEWNSETNSIIGGSTLIGKGYISVGQDTNYFQKWDVICKSKYSYKYEECFYYSHQYMQNLEAPYSEAITTYNAYLNNLGDGMHTNPFIFTIPIYKNMPESTSLPNSGSPINYLSSLVVNKEVITNFDSLTYDYSITLPYGTSSINIEATPIDSKAKITGIGDIEVEDCKIIEVVVISENGRELKYKITVNISTADLMTLEDTLNNIKTGRIDEEYLLGLTNIDTIKETFINSNSNANVVIKNTEGNIVTDGNIGTGYKVYITVKEETKELDIVLYGDTNGDGEITILDLLRVQKQLLSSINLDNSQLKASDINKDGKVDILDLLLIRKHLLGTSTINQ